MTATGERFDEFIQLLPAQQRLLPTWYKGTADAVYQNLDILRGHSADQVLVLAGDHVHKMDYAIMLADHVAHDAQATIACIDVPIEHARSFGVVAADAEGRIVGFVEKPADPPPLSGRPGRALASMGIYVSDADFLYAELLRDAADVASSHDFGHDLIPALLRSGARLHAHRSRKAAST